jgi:hypothetical protein
MLEKLEAKPSGLYQLAPVTTHARGCRGFATPVQALDSTRIYDAITPHNIRDISQDFRVWVLANQLRALSDKCLPTD